MYAVLHCSRLVQLMQLHYSGAGNLLGAELEVSTALGTALHCCTIQVALPDASRLVRSARRPGEPAFPILYQVRSSTPYILPGKI